MPSHQALSLSRQRAARLRGDPRPRRPDRPLGRHLRAVGPTAGRARLRGALPNVRGSTGYGQQFVEINRADWGGGDFKDVMAGVGLG